jgi:hypothetical protein
LKARRRIFRAKREVTGDWRQFHNEKLYKFRSSPNITGMMKPITMRGVEHIPFTGETRNAHKILVGKPENKT